MFRYLSCSAVAYFTGAALRYLAAVVSPLLPLVSARAGDGDGWLGQWVFPRNRDLPLRDRDNNVIMKWSVSKGKVLWVGNEWLIVRHTEGTGPYEGYVMKSEVVKLADAPQYFTGKIRQDEQNVWAWQCRAGAWTLKGEHDNAIKDFTELIRLDPAAYAYCERGIAWAAKGDHDRAIEDYDEAIRLDPTDAVTFNNRGIQWEAKKEYDKAIEDYSEAVRLNPNYSNAFNNRGYAWTRKEIYEKALADCNEAIRLDPTSINAYLFRGDIFYQKKDYDKAIEDYSQAIKLNPNDTGGYFGRGGVYMQKKEYDKAIAEYSQAIKLNPKNANGYRRRGNAFNQNKDYDKAIADYSQAMTVNPNDAFSFNKLAWFLATCPDASYRNGKRAIDLAMKACELTKWKESLFLGSLAAAHAEAGNYVKAIEFQKRALEDKEYQQRHHDYAQKVLKLYEQKKPYHETPDKE